MPIDPGQPTAPPHPPQKEVEHLATAPREDWSTACFSSYKESGCHYSLPLSGWQLPTGLDSAALPLHEHTTLMKRVGHLKAE